MREKKFTQVLFFCLGMEVEEEMNTDLLIYCWKNVNSCMYIKHVRVTNINKMKCVSFKIEEKR